jgi:hypothetical protein
MAAPGSFPGLVRELAWLAGKLIATPFHGQGTASPEFLRGRASRQLVFPAHWPMQSSG